MKAMIFAAGLGTRLKPLTDTLPKALVPVCGRPLLAHVVEKLRGAGVDSLVINVHHFAQKIKDYVADSKGFGLDVAISDESAELLDTGGGILNAEALLLKGGREPFLVHNVDIVSNLDIAWFRQQAEQHPDAVSTILVSRRKTQRYFLFDDGMRLVGWTNLATGEVRSPYAGLDASKCRMLAFAGIHLMSPDIFEAMRELGFSGKFSIVDFYLKACKGRRIQGVCPENLTLVDVGKFDSLQAAEELVASIEGTTASL